MELGCFSLQNDAVVLLSSVVSIVPSSISQLLGHLFSFLFDYNMEEVTVDIFSGPCTKVYDTEAHQRKPEVPPL